MHARLLLAILKEPRFLFTALLALVAYLALYLSAMSYLTLAGPDADGYVALDIQPTWRELLFRHRGPFLFEPIGIARVGPLVVFLSIPNLLIGAALGALIGANLAVSYHAFRTLGLRGARGLHALIGTVPALLSGAACCVPTLILAIGLQFTASLAALWSVLVPLSALLLVASLLWSLHASASSVRACAPRS